MKQAQATTATVEATEGKLEELKLFIQKKEWIDKTGSFLAKLPSFNTLDHTITLTQEAISLSWQEYDAIEAEIERFDVADLGRLKRIAQDASKLTLSSSDTDIIEIALSVLYAFDRLLLVKRQRRSDLSLATGRVLWEESVKLVRIEEKVIISGLEKFISKARWTIAATSSSSFPVSLAPLSISPMSWKLRLSTLTLELAAQKSKIHLLLKGTLPNSANLLDNFIDQAPDSLPEIFLDRQDKLEADLVGLNGLASFLYSLVDQFKLADHTFNALSHLESANEKFRKELKQVASSQDESTAESVRNFHLQISTATDSISSLRQSISTLPLPRHSKVTDQAAENSKLVTLLSTKLEFIQSELHKLQQYLKTFERSRTLRVEINECIEEVGNCTDSMDSKMREWESSKIIIPESVLDVEPSKAIDFVTTITSLLKQSSGLIVDLTKAELDRIDMREIMATLVTSRATLESRVNRMKRLISMLKILQETEVELENEKGMLIRAIQVSCWSESPSKGEEEEFSRADQVQAMITTLNDSNLSATMTSRVAGLSAAWNSNLSLRLTVQKVKEQTSRTVAFLDSNIPIISAIKSASSDTLSFSGTLEESATLSDRLQELEQLVEKLNETAHLRIPFLDSPSSPFDFSFVDSQIRVKVNRVLAEDKESLRKLRESIKEVINALEERKRIEEAEAIEAIKMEGERIEKERLEAIRVENEIIRLEGIKMEEERIEKERLEAIRVENEIIRLEGIKMEEERIEKERLEAIRVENEIIRLEGIKMEKERVEKERLEAIRVENEIIRLEGIKMEEERVEKERLEAIRVENEQLAAEKYRLETTTSNIPFPSSTLIITTPTSQDWSISIASAESAISDLLESIDSIQPPIQPSNELPILFDSTRLPSPSPRPLLSLADASFIAERAIAELRASVMSTDVADERKRRILVAYQEITEMVEDLRKPLVPLSQPSRPSSRWSTTRKREKSMSGIPAPVSRPITPFSSTTKSSLSRSTSSLSHPSSDQPKARRTVSASLNSKSRSNASRFKDTPPLDLMQSRVVDREVERIVGELALGVDVNAADNNSDLSGIFWIGTIEPKLYFVRILRSHIAMVRVGGGWSELGLFLSTHFQSSAAISPSNSIQSSLQSSTSALSLSLSQRSSSFSSSSIDQSPVRKRKPSLPRWRP